MLWSNYLCIISNRWLRNKSYVVHKTDDNLIHFLFSYKLVKFKISKEDIWKQEIKMLSQSCTTSHVLEKASNILPYYKIKFQLIYHWLRCYNTEYYKKILISFANKSAKITSTLSILFEKYPTLLGHIFSLFIIIVLEMNS